MILSYSKYTFILSNFTCFCNSFNKVNAAVVKLADALDSKSSGLIPRVGSSPTSGTKKERIPLGILSFLLVCLDENRRFGFASITIVDERPPSAQVFTCMLSFFALLVWAKIKDFFFFYIKSPTEVFGGCVNFY